MPDDLKNLTPDELELLSHAKTLNPWAQISMRSKTLIKLLADLDAARGIIAKFPKTADGVPIVPGMVLWQVFDYGDGDNYSPSEPHRMDPIAGFKVVDGEVREVIWRNGWSIVVGSLLYSTREAALAAKGTVGT